MKNLENSIQKLGDLAARLNDTSDFIASVVKSLEEKISSTRIGLEIWLESIPLGKHDDVWSELGWAKCDGGWHIAVRDVYERVSVDVAQDPQVTISRSSPSPLSNAPRALRIEAAPHLPALLDALVAKAELQVKKIEQLESDLLADVEIPF